MLFLFLCLIIICLEFSPPIVAATTNVKEWSTKTAVEKGDVFQIRVKIGTEPVSNLLVVSISPAGFVVEPILQPGLEKVSTTVSDGERIPAIRIKSLAPGSEIWFLSRYFHQTFWATKQYMKAMNNTSLTQPKKRNISI